MSAPSSPSPHVRRAKFTYGRRHASDATYNLVPLAAEPRKRSMDTEVIPDSEADVHFENGNSDRSVTEGILSAAANEEATPTRHSWAWTKKLKALDNMTE